jgi:hypothetical protein
MEFLNNLKNKKPVYLSVYNDIIDRYTLKQGGKRGTSSEEQKFEQSKFFSTKYEVFMYAIILGLKNNYALPLHDGAKKEDFWEVTNWKPKELVDYIIMCLIAESDIDLNKLEQLEEDELSNEALKIRKLMEEYANGGFDILRSKLEDNPEFDNNELCFIDLLDEVVHKTQQQVR